MLESTGPLAAAGPVADRGGRPGARACQAASGPGPARRRDAGAGECACPAALRLGEALSLACHSPLARRVQRRTVTVSVTVTVNRAAALIFLSLRPTQKP